jgi:cobalt-zinc-cadmium efflux system outer membrane protein
MTGPRTPALRAAIGLAAAFGCVAHASEPWPDRRPLANDSTAFRAPAKPLPEDAKPEELAPEPAAPLFLKDALALALMRNPELAVFSWEERASEARELQAGMIPNPDLDMRVNRLGIPRQSAEKDDKRSRVILSQQFELGGKRRRRVELARTERYLAGWDYEAKRVEVATVVARRFVAVVGAQLRVAASESYLEFFVEMRERVAKAVDGGAMRNVDLLQVTRRVGLTRIELQRAESELSAARFGLAATWSNPSPQFTVAAGDLEPLSPIPPIETVLELAERGPAIARWDAELERSRAALALAKSGRVPDLTAGAGVRWQEHTSEKDYLVDFEISIPLFDRKQGEIREARYGIARAHAARQAAEAASTAEIVEFYFALAEAEARATTLRDEILPAARETFEAFRVGFDTGAEPWEGLLDARRDVARAEISYVEALVDYHGALATVEGVIGRSLTGTD